MPGPLIACPRSQLWAASGRHEVVESDRHFDGRLQPQRLHPFRELPVEADEGGAAPAAGQMQGIGEVEPGLASIDGRKRRAAVFQRDVLDAASARSTRTMSPRGKR